MHLTTCYSRFKKYRKMAAPTLTDLPAELISQIAPYLVQGRVGSYSSRLYGLYGLRLTCRTLHAKTLFDFSKAAFSTLFVDFSLQSLDRLHVISQHPTFCKAVKCIYFAHDMYNPVRLAVGYENPDMSLEEQIQSMLREGLKRILGGLSKLRKVVIITPFVACFYRCYFTCREEAPQTTMRHSEAHPEPTLVGEKYEVTADALYRLLLEAADISSTEMESLEIQHWSTLLVPLRTCRDAFGVCIHSLFPHYKALRGIREFRLSLDLGEHHCPCVRPPTKFSERIQDVNNALCRTLQSMPQLSVLKISFTNLQLQDIPRRYKIIRSLATLHLPHLIAFGLSSVYAEEGSLNEFLLKHKNQFQALLFEKVKIMNGGTWATLLTSLLNNCMTKLSELDLERLYDVERMNLFLIDQRQQIGIHLKCPDIAEKFYAALAVMRCAGS